jgi:hypothetical protein
MSDQNEVDLDSVIDRLLEVRGSRPGKQVQLLEAEIRYLCTKAREIFISQPILLELEAPIKVSTAPNVNYLPHRVSTDIELPRSAATFTDNTTISYDSSSTADSPLRRTTCSLVTTWTEANNHWRPSASFWRTRSNTQRISSSFEATTNALQSTAFMASTTSARGGTISNYGRPLRIASTACPSRQSLMRRYSPCTVG